MSAIWGVIDLNNKKLDKGLMLPFQQVYESCKIDRIDAYFEDNIYMACGLQYFTKESRLECMPIIDKENDIYFVADCILDNREEIINELGLDTSIPDGTVMYEAYKRWGEKCSERFLGPYSFVVYDKREDKVIVAANHAFSRSIFYVYHNDKVYFSTLQEPLHLLNDYPHSYNKRWIFDCITIVAPCMISEHEETIHENIYKVPAATYMRFEKGKEKKKIQYWNIENCKKWKATDEEYCNAILKVCNEAARSAMRTDAPLGIMLSSGLDSSSVAGICASVLKEKGEKLYSFTSVPEKDFKYDKGYYIPDETEGVMAICDYWGNIDPEFVACEGMNVIDDVQYLIDMYDEPIKSKQNSIWMAKISEKAYEKGCRVILDGQLGNTTISAGNIFDYLYDLLIHGHIFSAYHEWNVFCKKYRYSRKHIAKMLFKQICETLCSPVLQAKEDIFRYSFTNKKEASLYKVEERLRRLHFNMGVSQLQTYKKYRKCIVMEDAFSQIGELKTINGLKNGVIIRDIFKDKRVLELCYSFPMKVFVSEGYERRIARKYMKDYIPDSIRLDVNHRGRQSADYIFRVQKRWDAKRKEITDTVMQSDVVHYIDRQKFMNIITHITSENIYEYGLQVDQILVIYILAKYMDEKK